MNPQANTLQLVLNAGPQQRQRLEALQLAFARACNALAPLVQQTRCWNRVALHHLAYKQMRARFPELGSQMVCNAIYSVSRTARIVYQHPESPFNLQRLGARALPLLQFSPRAPVYFDRHTLSLKDGGVSLFTLDGRMRFEIKLGAAGDAAHEQRFRDDKLRELVLLQVQGEFTLNFSFGAVDAPEVAGEAAELVVTPATAAFSAAGAARPVAPAPTPARDTPLRLSAWPEYVSVQAEAGAAPQPFHPIPAHHLAHRSADRPARPTRAARPTA